MNISPRLQHIADLVSPNVIMADIGTDHGYLPLTLLNSGKIPFAIATDIHLRPLEKAMVLLEKAGLSHVCECRLGSGFQTLNAGECDEIVVAGMGGLMIRDMLMASEKIARSADRLIFQPMNNSATLRSYLSEHHYEILHESIVQENERYYEVMVVRDGKMPSLSLEEQFAGFCSARKEDKVFEGFIIDLIEKTKKILLTVSQKDSQNARERAEECRRLIEALQEIGRKS